MIEEHTAHSELPPSSADKWFHCPAWRKLTADIENTSSPAAIEGTIAHQWLADHLTGMRDLVECDDPEMSDHLFMCAEWAANQPGEMYVEIRVDYGAMFGYEDLTGTSDLIFVTPDDLTVGDLKYGRGVVEVGETIVFGPEDNEDHKPIKRATNLQLLCYLAGAIYEFGPRPRYRLVILQPRAWHTDGWLREAWLTHKEFEDFAAKLGPAIVASYGRNPQAQAGSWCRHYCSALSRCQTAAKLSLDVFRSNPID